MEKFLHLLGLFVSLDIYYVCHGYPVDLQLAGDGAGDASGGWATLALGAAALMCCVLLVAGCMCCRRSTKGFQEFTDSTSSHSLSGACASGGGGNGGNGGGGCVNSAGAGAAEFTMFPPPAAGAAAAGQAPGDRASVVRFEPLPELHTPAAAAAAAAAASRRPAAFSSAVSHGLSANDWFENPHANFPRSQLKYVRELGRGWFGRAVEGEACGLAGRGAEAAPAATPTRVVVKILHEDATATDHMFFLHEARPYRDLCHPNVLRLLGRCLEADPFLVLLEACSSGDLKSFLSQNISTAEALSQQGVTLLMCCQVASGLQFMHQHGFVHTDLAARNCLVTSDLTVKIGDYGVSIDTFKEDYYCTSDVALPIRWCAPETLHCTDTTIETKEVTPSANVWSLGVVLWEICEFGKLPYEDLSDDEVIVKVLVEVSKCLPVPSRLCPHRHNLYHLMKLCWSPAADRPALPQVHAMLNHLYGNREFASIDNDGSSSQADEDFERRWETFKPNSIPVTDNHVTSTSTDVHRPSSLLGSDPSDLVPPVLITSNLASEINILNRELPKSSTQPSHEVLLTPQESPFLLSDLSPLTTSPQPSLTSSSGGEIFLPSLQHRHKSPSLQNLRGSLDDLSECNGPMPEEEEEEFVKHEVISEEETRSEGLPEEPKSETLNTNISDSTADTVVMEPDFDSWLQGVETTDEEDAKFVRKISEAIRDLDNALALEKTSSSSSSAASSKSGSHHQSPSKDVGAIASDENVVLDFRLGPSELQNDRFMTKSVCLLQPDSLLDDSLVEKSQMRDTNNKANDSGTDTEDETWRKRIECGEFTAKVKEKSKSVADLMVLTHIDCSDGSDSEPPSLTWNFDRGSNSRSSVTRQRRGSSFRGGNLNTNALAFASESNIHQAVLGEEFRNTLLKLHEAQKDQRNRLGSLELSPLNHEATSEETLTNSADPLLPTSNFLCDADDFENLGLKIDSPTCRKNNNFLALNASEDNTVQSTCVSIEAGAGSQVDTKSVTATETNTPDDHCAIADPIIIVSNLQPVENKREEIICVSAAEKTESDLSFIITPDESTNKQHKDSSTYSCEISNSRAISIEPSVVNQSATSGEASESSQILVGDNIEMELTGNISTSLPPSNDTSVKVEYCQSVEDIDDGKVIDIDDSLCEGRFVPELKCTSTPKSTSFLLDMNNSSSDLAMNKNESKKVLDFDGIQEITQDMETSLSNSSLILSNSDSRDATFNSSDANPNSNISVQSGISTDSFEFVPVMNSEAKVCSTPTDPLDIEQKEISSGTNNENMSNSISEGSVILGPCEDYTLDYFKGLKTISKDTSPFLSNDSDHTNTSDSSESPYEEEPNVIISSEANDNCVLDAQVSSLQTANELIDTSPRTSEYGQTETKIQDISSGKIASELKNGAQDGEHVSPSKVKCKEENTEEKKNDVQPGAENVISDVSANPKKKHISDSTECHTSQAVETNLHDECSKLSMASNTLDSIDRLTCELQHTPIEVNCQVVASFLEDIPCGSGCTKPLEKISEKRSLSSSSPASIFSPEKDDVFSMDPDSLNEQCRDKVLMDMSIDSVEAMTESSVPNIINDSCEKLVEAETLTNVLNSGVDSSEGKSDASLSVSLENEVPTVVASTLGRSSDSNVEYDSSDTLVSLEHSIPELDLQDKSLCTIDDSPSPELFEDKKAASFAFLQQEINSENLYRQKPVINICTVEPVFPSIVLATNNSLSQKDSNHRGSAENLYSVSEKSELVPVSDVSSLNLISSLPSSTVFPNMEKFVSGEIQKNDKTSTPSTKSNEIKEIIAVGDEETVNVISKNKVKSSNESMPVLPEYNTPEVSALDMKDDIGTTCRVISHYAKDVPLEVVPSIHSCDTNRKDMTYVPVSELEGNSQVISEINVSAENINVHNDQIEDFHSPKQLCFSENNQDFLDPKDTIEKWKQPCVDILNEEFLHSQKHSDHNCLGLGLGLANQEFGSDYQPENDTTVDLEDGEDYGLDVAKHSTPDDERSSDSGFRDKGSLSESCEDACDEKYNLEDIEAELEETFNKGGFAYVVKGIGSEDDDLEHHTSSEELPHEHLADHDDTATSERNISDTEADISSTLHNITIDKKDSEDINNVNVSSHHSELSELKVPELDIDPPLKENDLNIKTASKPVFQSASPSGTPDLLNIETNDTPMPDVTSPHGISASKLNHSTSAIGKPSENHVEIDNDLKSAMSEGFDVDIQSRFCQEKDLILDIGQTEFRALSPEQPSPLLVDSGESSPMKKAGWFLHPQSSVDFSEENYDSNLDDVFMSPKSTSSSTSNGEEGSNENHYAPFSLNEEFVAAIRNELQEKLPCAQQQTHENSEEDGMLEPEDETLQDERTDITIHYNVYPPPLSPILEERESVSSITTTLSDNFVSRGAQQAESDSEPASPVFVLDTVDLVSVEADAKRFEEEIREALENCSLSSADSDSFSDKEKNKSVLLEDLDQPHDDKHSELVNETINSNNITLIKSTSPQSEYDDDFLVIDTETNQATLLESPKPKSHLAFIKKQLPLPEDKITEDSPSSDILKNGSSNISSDESAHECLKLEVDPETCLSDEDAFTPDSISPGQSRERAPSYTVITNCTDNPSGVTVSSDKSSVSTDSIELPPSLCIPTPYSSYVTDRVNYPELIGASLGIVEEISIGVANNEAAEIISELESSGIINGSQQCVEYEDFVPMELETSTKFTCDDSSREESDGEESEGISLEESSDSLKSPDKCKVKRSLSLDLTSIQHGNSLKRCHSHESICKIDQPEDTQNYVPATIEVTRCEDEEEVEDDEDEGQEDHRRLTDTLDIFKKKKVLEREEESNDRDWSVTSLEAAVLSTKAPMPSPEDESWKQIPSMLAFSDLNEMMSRCSKDEEFSDGYAGITSPGFPAHDNDEDLMSTSFSLKDSEDIGDCYTPDWESEDDTNEEDNNSSSSGEFIWKEGDKEASVKAVDIEASAGASKPFESLSEFGMEVIAEEEEEEEEDEDEGEDDVSMSSGSGTEFIPSAWNSEATPNRSALRSPDKKQEQKKNVSFKKQKYHCVYEYPREASDSESEGTDSPSRRRWDLYQPDVDYASYADWELVEGDVAESSGPDLDTDPEVPQSQPIQTFDFYKLSNVDCDFNTGVVSEDGEFYISSSARPFQFSGTNSDIFCGNGSEFFPGQLYRTSNDEDLSAPPTEITDVSLQFLPFEGETDNGDGISKCREKADTSSPNAVESESNDNHIETKVIIVDTQQHSPVNTDLPVDEVMDAEESREKVLPNVSSNLVREPESPGSPLDSSPTSPLSPTSGLGELRHTRDRLKLDLPSSGSTFVLEPPALSKRRSVETIKGEASLLDSGEETEDSGIESSNGTNSSKTVKPAETSLPNSSAMNLGKV